MTADQRDKILKKIRIAGKMFARAMRNNSRQIKREHPTWSEQQIKEEALRLIELACP